MNHENKIHYCRSFQVWSHLSLGGSIHPILTLILPTWLLTRFALTHTALELVPKCARHLLFFPKVLRFVRNNMTLAKLIRPA